MINRPGLMRIIGDLENGFMPLPGEVAILRDAVMMLDEMASTLDKIMGRGPAGYDLETTAQLKIIEDRRGGE